ncbi:MAG: hypothetical protein Q7O12_10605 [Deltaproteobacteria bacterium]|nr:hypothetical protein [Deltaproteobacteria bacterium]
MQLGKLLRFGLPVLLAIMLLAGGCSAYSSVKQWAGYGSSDEDEETVPPEAQQETVMIDGKPYVRSKNPYWLTEPQAPEYLYVEKGREFTSAQQYLVNSLADAMNKRQGKGAGKTIPPDKLQEMVRSEVDRILREQGLGGFVSQGKGGDQGIFGRAVAVIPDLETSKSYDGLNRTLAMALGSALGKTKDLKVSPPESVQEALRKVTVAGKMTLAPNIKALGDVLGVQGIVLTGIMAPEGGGQGAMVMQVYDTFTGLQEDAIVAPGGAGGVKPDTVTKFAQDNYLRVAGNLTRIAWFGRVEFVKEGKVYLSLGQTSGLKVGDRLKVVEPGKEVVNPKNHSVLGYTADVPQGEIKVTELLGNSGAVGLALNGGPFKANDKVKAVK